MVHISSANATSSVFFLTGVFITGGGESILGKACLIIGGTSFAKGCPLRLTG